MASSAYVQKNEDGTFSAVVNGKTIGSYSTQQAAANAMTSNMYAKEIAAVTTSSRLPTFSESPSGQKVVSKNIVIDQINQKNLTGPYAAGKNTPAAVPTTKVEPIDGGVSNLNKNNDASLAGADTGSITGDVPDGFRNGGVKFGEDGNGGRNATISITYKKISNGAVGELISNYGRFILQSVSESVQEKYQIVETFTNYYIYFFGQKPTVYNFSGTLINSENYKWANDMEYIYDKMLRGTKLAEINGTAIIEYDGKMVKGYPIQMAMNKDAMSDKGVPFSFSMIIVEIAQLPQSIEIEDMIEQAQQEFAAIEEEKKKYLSRLSQNVPPKAAAAVTQVMNGQASAFTGAIEPYLKAVPQGYVEPSPDLTNVGNNITQNLLNKDVFKPVVFNASNSPKI